ncbi:Methyl-CpG-binding domain-containing protein 9 [Acorus gramineus]|uniref:Methyl-CpG-binding domain-containing protein 9 n=1 Tax=Acorus gramineus TaxID=55184 RepID=A0AAV9B0Q8_ACOGR|nr:Methyl-CpG-binding domain-containing protein 9 [Acorus gramineus]
MDPIEPPRRPSREGRPFLIDLNEVPSPPSIEPSPSPVALDALTVVRRSLPPVPFPPGRPADHPGQPGFGLPLPCGSCGQPETRGYTLVCDGCEQGFHVLCVIGGGGGGARPTEDWLCGPCLRSGERNKRWPLGAHRTKGGVRLLDMNALPAEADGEGDGFDGFDNARQTSGEHSFHDGSHMPQSNLVNQWNEFDLEKDSSTIDTVKDSQDIQQHQLTVTRNPEPAVFGQSLQDKLIVNSSIPEVPSHMQADIFLQKLRKSMSEGQGLLDGWHVEMKQCSNRSEMYPVYCGPDGKRFESMSEVARYLGISLDLVSIDSRDRNNEIASSHKALPARRRKKELARLSRRNSVTGNSGSVGSGGSWDISSCPEVMELSHEVWSDTAVVNDGSMANASLQHHHLNMEFPVQYEDFLLVSLGKVVPGDAYHDAAQIWPIGYRSSWHDRITGSFFECEVTDRCHCGPVFKVKRRPCSTLALPVGATFISYSNLEENGDTKVETDGFVTQMDYGEDDEISVMLLDPSSSEHNILSCFGNCLPETSRECNLGTEYGLLRESNGSSERSGSYFDGNMSLSDDIGEFCVEGRSSLLVWKLVAKTLIDICREAYKRSGTFHLLCRHDMTVVEGAHGLGSLARFCYFSGPFNTLRTVRSADELETCCEALGKWLDQDRFGLDVDFVQELIEHLPGVLACSQYVFLNDRRHHSTSQTVGSGILLAKRNNGSYGKEGEMICASLGLQGRSIKQEDTQFNDRFPPPGRRLSSRLPKELIGDFLEIWEFLWRFHDVLGLKEPLSFEELEDELIEPWSNGATSLHKLEKEIQEGSNSTAQKTESTFSRNRSSTGESDLLAEGENPLIFIPMETVCLKEAAQARAASRTYKKCTGTALTKIHTSLLNALVGELQCKAAAVADPTFDSGDIKSRRGKRKDMDNTLPLKKSKIDMLPVNELTWPELARRYILAFSAMDGSLDFSEISMRDAAKVFRCLQGDGGALCGSLAGVASMEADALLLAEAESKIFPGSVNCETEGKAVDCKLYDTSGCCETSTTNGGDIPEWAQLLEPVRKLPTNVGTRIRKCIYDALDKNPPEWAGDVLKHSISKEVYKGNAAGPTKKAVIHVLNVVYGYERDKVIKERKGKKRVQVSSRISDSIMKQCRLVLRLATSADEDKVFSNLLGSTLLNGNDNEEEGILGSPAMFPRPLDFRTIDLRLETGAYGGSHEAFLEDVREVWKNIRTSYGDKPDLMELAEKLSQTFELLYEEKVLNLVKKRADNANGESSNAAAPKSPDEDVPKANWESGICKVCGIDRADSSVLLCDTCDSEYHTYCLNPPLARVPKGDWYCPSCTVQRKAQGTSPLDQGINLRSQGRQLGDETRAFLVALNFLADRMEKAEYWEFNIGERILLLKFLCHEALNSAFIREHLDQCAETLPDLQQKLRSLYSEWRNLKFQELTEKTEENSNIIQNVDAFSEAQLQSGTSIAENGFGETMLGGIGKCSGLLFLKRFSEKLHDGSEDPRNLTHDPSEMKLEDVQNNCRPSLRRDEYNKSNGQLQPIASQRDGGFASRDMLLCNNEHENSRNGPSNLRTHDIGMEANGPMHRLGLYGSHLLSGNGNALFSRNAPTMPLASSVIVPLTEPSAANIDSLSFAHQHSIQPGLSTSQVSFFEMNPQKRALQDSIGNIESQLLKMSFRRELLGRDSYGRLYWLLSRPDERPRLVVEAKPKTNCASSSDLKRDRFCLLGSSWTLYESGSEIQGLIQWLEGGDAREKELKDSILQWFRFGSQQVSNCAFEITQLVPDSLVSEKSVTPYLLVTKALAILEKKYGSCLEPETNELPKKRGRKSKTSFEERLYRCDCLEPVWPSRYHCLSCHWTFCTSVELEGHNNGKCSSIVPSDGTKENGDYMKGKGMRYESGSGKIHGDEVDVPDASKNRKFNLSSRLVKHEKASPFDFGEICNKFVTNNSNMELVEEVGLIGLGGIPSFVPSVPEYFVDPTLMLHPNTESKHNQMIGLTDSWEDPTKKKVGLSQRSVENGSYESWKSERRVSRWDNPGENIPQSNTRTGSIEPDQCCIISQYSLQRVVGRNSAILRRLKINLLDMDAALANESLRAERASSQRRCTWRAYVKSADSIYEIVLAMLIFEGMIKTEFLNNRWWYWSSLTAAAKTSTLSALALRIYTLDSSIIYEKTSSSSSDVVDNMKLVTKAGKKRRDADG